MHLNMEENIPEICDYKEKIPAYVSVAVVVFGILDVNLNSYRSYLKKKLGVLLIHEEESFSEGKYVLPQGQVYRGETLQGAVKRVIKEKTGLSGIYCEQVHTFDITSDKEPEGSVLCVHMAVTARREALFQGADWISVDRLTDIETDTDGCYIVQKVLDYLRRYIYITDIIFHVMPEKFTLTELQQIYEVILDSKIFPIEFKRNIGKKITETNEYSNMGPKREKLYRY